MDIVVIAWSVLYFLLAIVLYPPDMAEGEDYAAVFERNRGWFLGLFVASALVDILLTALCGDLFDPRSTCRSRCTSRYWDASDCS